MSIGTELLSGSATADELRSLQQVGSLQRVQTDFATAMSVQIPRTLSSVEKRLIEEANIACEAFFYAWGAGKDRIEGPTVGLAMSLARTWGNCALQLRPVQDLSDCWIFTACFVDLETGFTLERQFRQSKNWKVYGKFDEARKDDIRFQIGQSKAVRNVVVNALPRFLVRKAIEQAKRGVRDKVLQLIDQRGEDNVRESAVTKLVAAGVPEERVLAKFGRETVKALSVEDLVLIWGDINALTNGLDTATNLYPQKRDSLEEIASGVGAMADELAAGGLPPTASGTTPATADRAGNGRKPAAKNDDTGQPGDGDSGGTLESEFVALLQSAKSFNGLLMLQQQMNAKKNELGATAYTTLSAQCQRLIDEAKTAGKV